MGSTSRFGLPSPDQTDAPNGPEQIGALATAVDGKLARAFPCTSTTKPTGLTTADRGFLVDVGDLARIERWDGSAWQVVGPTTVTGGGGGGGGTTTLSTVSATYAGSAAQPVSTETDVVVAFPTVLVADGAVTRNTAGAGHSFTLTQTRLWLLSTTVRFAEHSDTGGRTVEIRAGTTILAKEGEGDPAAPAWTRSLSVARKLTAATVITVVVRHDAGTSLALEPNNGQYVHIDLAGV